MNDWKVEPWEGRQASSTQTCRRAAPGTPAAGQEAGLALKKPCQSNLRQGSQCPLQAYPFAHTYGRHTTLSTSQWGSHPESLGSLDGNFSLRPGLPSLRRSLPCGGWPTLSKETRRPKATGPCSLRSGLAEVSKLAELVTAESRQWEHDYTRTGGPEQAVRGPRDPYS